MTTTRQRTTGRGPAPAATNRTAAYDTTRAAALARQKARESQNRRAGKSYLQLPPGLKRVEPKDNESTLLSVIAYIVKEAHHPDGIPVGELWFKRPFSVHRNIGQGDEKRPMCCPRTFNPKSACVVDNDIEEWRKDYERNKKAISTYKRSNRDLLLVWNHTAKEIQYLDEPYGGKAAPGFGALLDSRLANPRKEIWAAFWLPGLDGMALDIMWSKVSLEGGGDWIKPVSIDFIEREAGDVPDEIWEKGFDISTLLIKTTSRDIEIAHYGIDEDDLPEDASGEEADDCQKPDDAPQTRTTTRGRTRNTTVPSETTETAEAAPNNEGGEQIEADIPFDQMDKMQLLDYAKANELKDHDGNLIHTHYRRKTEDEVYGVITNATGGDAPVGAEVTEGAAPGPDETQQDPQYDPENACPEGLEFGVKFNEDDKCQHCVDEAYDACRLAKKELTK